MYLQVSDVNDDVRRAAVISIGFLLFNSPEQCPNVVSLLSESYNSHVRYGAALALGISCAGLSGSGDKLCRFVRVWGSVEKVYQGLGMSCSGFPGSVDQVCQVRGSGLPGIGISCA